MTKLQMVIERPEHSQDSRWADTGDRYMLKLLKNYIFHRAQEDGRAWTDLAHVVQCLNKLDAGVAEKVCLVSPDEKNIMVRQPLVARACLSVRVPFRTRLSHLPTLRCARPLRVTPALGHAPAAAMVFFYFDTRCFVCIAAPSTVTANPDRLLCRPQKVCAACMGGYLRGWPDTCGPRDVLASLCLRRRGARARHSATRHTHAPIVRERTFPCPVARLLAANRWSTFCLGTTPHSWSVGLVGWL